MPAKWTEAQRKKFAATMRARKKKAVLKTERPHNPGPVDQVTVYIQESDGALHSYVGRRQWVFRKEEE
jgi:hypothetical protein